MRITVGDVVALKSGGPDMTVETVGDGGVFCLWFDGARRNRKLFPAATLAKPGKAASAPPDVTFKFVKADGQVISIRKLGGQSQ